MIGRTVCLTLLLATACDSDPGRVSNLVENRSPLPDVSSANDVTFDTGLETQDTTTPPDTTPVETQDTAQPETQDTTQPETQDTTQPETQDTADTTPPDTADTADTADTVDTTLPDTTDTTQPDSGPVGPVDLNVGFIGGACDAVSDCAYANSQCMPANEGWTNGMCTQSCTSTCPDQAGAAVTFCIDGDSVGESGGMCVQKCDLAKSETGCRLGYSCADELRVNTSTTSAWTCLPGELDGCLQEMMARGIEFTLPGTTNYDSASGKVCEVYEPVRVAGTINGVNFRPSDFTNAPAPMYVQCGVALALYDMAELAKTRGITDFVHYGTYNCRVIAGTTTLSEHSYANAIDIAGIQTAGGQRYTVLSDWEDGDTTPDSVGGELLFWLAHTMHDLRLWNIILTPEYNAAHDNHFHIDLTPGSWFLSE